jgi:biotin-dependent carboxylase-like uncharacterized protein
MTPHATLEVVSVSGLAWLQDGGRVGFMADGVPPGGALVPEHLALTNRAVGNRAGTCAIEVFGGITLRAIDALVEIGSSEGVRTIAAGETFALAASTRARVQYVAVRGGFDVPVALGGRGTLLVAKLGGLAGRSLRRGDYLEIGRESERARATLPSLELGGVADVRVVIGPDDDAFTRDAIDTLTRGVFTISAASDRVGTRLEGALLARTDYDDALSRPMVRGAIEVPLDGVPIVLGPDHPTTGGYPVIAVVASADLGRIGALSPGARVQFRAVSVDASRRAWREWLETYGD